MHAQPSILPFYEPSDKVIVRSSGCYLYDDNETRFIDFDSGVWCANLGHSHPDVIRAMEQQMRLSLHHGYRFRNHPGEQLSEKLLELGNLTGGQSVFLSSGSEAVNLAITLARHLSGKRRVLRTGNSYLSAYGHGQISDENSMLMAVPMNDGKALSTIDFSQLAAFVFEPGTAYGLIHFPEPAFVEAIYRKARAAGCLLIADEVTTGFGRTGKWFGYQHYNIQPDMIVCGKGMGNGYPVSALSVSGEVAARFKKARFRYAQSHQNDPLGCATALEVIRVMKTSDILAQCNRTGSYFREKLDQLKSRHPAKLSEVRSRGLMLALEFDGSIDVEAIFNRLFSQGFVPGYKENVLRFMPPLSISTTDIDQLAEALEGALGNR